MNQNVNGISQYLNVLSDPLLQQYARQAGINALGTRQQVIQQLAVKLASQGYEVALAGRGNQAVGLNTAFGGFNQSFAQQIRSNRGTSNGSRSAQYNLQDLQKLPSFASGSNRSPLRTRSVNQVGQSFDLRTKRGGNNPAGVNQYTENDRDNNGNRGSFSKSRTDANRGVFSVSPVRTNPLSPVTRKIEQTLRNANTGAVSPRFSQQSAISPRFAQQTALSPRPMSPSSFQQAVNKQSFANQTGLTVLPSGRMIGNVSPVASNSLRQTFAPQNAVQRALSPLRSVQQSQGLNVNRPSFQGAGPYQAIAQNQRNDQQMRSLLSGRQ